MAKPRVAIIEAVKRPLGFFTLVVLVGEVILGGLATRAAGSDFTLLIVGMLALLFALVIVVFRLAKSGEQPVAPAPKSRRYDVFLSSVLAGYEDDERLLAEKSLLEV